MFGANKDFFHTGLRVGRSDLHAMMDGMGPGDHYFVDYRNGNDANDGKTWAKAFRTYSKAVDAVVSNHNDVIHINGDSEVLEASMVTISKNRVHTIGHNGALGLFGQGARIACNATSGATNIASVQNTGVRNTFVGLKISSAMVITESLYAFVEAGEFTRFFNCSFYKSSDLDNAGASEMALNGESTMFYDCTFGSSVNITGNIRANVLLTGGIVSGKKCKGAYFEDCLFLSTADDTDKVMVYGANATDVERMLLMKNCVFMNNLLSAGTPAHAVGFGAAQTQGTVLLVNCVSVDCTVMAEAGVGIYVSGSVPTFATTGVALTA